MFNIQSSFMVLNKWNWVGKRGGALMLQKITFETFVSIIAESLGIDKSLLTEEVSLRDDIGIDSLSIINFIVKIERQYNIKFNTNLLSEARTLGAVYRLFMENLTDPQ